VVASPDSCQCRPASQGPSRSMDDHFLKEEDEWRVQGRAFGGSRPTAATPPSFASGKQTLIDAFLKWQGYR
jgi:hypothetical protein